MSGINIVPQQKNLRENAREGIAKLENGEYHVKMQKRKISRQLLTASVILAGFFLVIESWTHIEAFLLTVQFNRLLVEALLCCTSLIFLFMSRSGEEKTAHGKLQPPLSPISKDKIKKFLKITNAQDLSFRSKMQALLEFGCETFELEYGAFAKITNDTCSLEYAAYPQKGSNKGFPANETERFSRITFDCAELLAIQQASESIWKDHLGLKQCGYESYLGTTVSRSGSRYGVLSFSSEKPHAKTFTSYEKDLLALIAQWIGTELSRNHDLEALQNSEEKFRSSFNYSAIGVALVSLDGHWLQVNRSLCKMLGYSEAELRKKTFQEITHPDDLEKDLSLVAQLLRDEIDTYQIEKRYYHKDGHCTWGLLSVSLVKSTDGTPIHFISQIQDINAQRNSELALKQLNSQLEVRVTERAQALQESEGRFRFLADAMPQIVWTATTTGAVDYFNARWFEYTGMTIEQTNEFVWQPVIHPEDLEGCLQHWNASLQAGINYEVEYRFRRADGEYRWQLGRALPLRDSEGNVVKWFGTCTDIHDKKLAEQSLRWGEQRYRSLLRATSDIIWTTTPSGEFGGEQSSWAAFTGQTEADYSNNGWLEVIHPDDRDHTVQTWLAAVATQSAFSSEHRIRSRDGEYRVFSAKGVPIPELDGTIREWIGAHIDVTDKKLGAEKALAHVSSELRESELRYRSVAESANDPIISADASGRIISWNKSAEKIFGYTDDESVGMPLSVIMPKRFSNSYDRILNHVRDGGDSKLLNNANEMTGVKRSGEEFPMELSLSSWHSSAGQCFTAMIRDITDRKKVEGELALEATRRSAIIQVQSAIAQAGLDFEKVLSLVTTGIQALTNAEGSSIEMIEGEETVCKAASGMAKAHLGLRLDINRSISGHCIRTQQVQRCNDIETNDYVNKEACREFGVRSVLVVPLQHAGHTVGVLKVCSSKLDAFPEADLQTLVLVANSIGASISQIQSFEERQTLLEQISRSNQELRSATEAKSLFLANMSHEIRTPLTSIIGFTESVLMEEMDAEERMNALETVIRNGKHLVGIINDILDLSKIEAGKMDLELRPANIHDLVIDISNLLQHRSEEKGIAFGFEFVYPIPKAIVTDVTRLKQILFNLIGNAIKFTAKGGVKIVVSFDMDKQLIQFAVCDTGIGLKPEQIDLLFKPFSQADVSTTRKYGGTGLGLIISAELATKLGGAVSVTSTSGIGSVFTVTVRTGPISETSLEYNVATITKRKPTIAETFDGSTIAGTILVAEDGVDNQNFISFLLRKTKLNVTMVENGSLAVQAAMAGNFDIILMDMQMPTMDGYTATKILREKGFSKPIIALTANAMTTDVERCLSAGCTAHLGKPFERADFFSTIKKYIRSDKPSMQQQESKPLLVIQDDDPEFIELILIFLEGVPERLQEIEEAANENDWNLVARLGHKLRGSAFAYPALKDAAFKLEEAALEGTMLNRKERLKQLTVLLSAITDTKKDLITLLESPRPQAEV